MKNSPASAYVLHKILNLVISLCCFADDGKEMYKLCCFAEHKRTRTVIVFVN